MYGERWKANGSRRLPQTTQRRTDLLCRPVEARTPSPLLVGMGSPFAQVTGAGHCRHDVSSSGPPLSQRTKIWSKALPLSGRTALRPALCFRALRSVTESREKRSRDIVAWLAPTARPHGTAIKPVDWRNSCRPVPVSDGEWWEDTRWPLSQEETVVVRWLAGVRALRCWAAGRAMVPECRQGRGQH
jgi:hypothetical protein